MDDVKKFYQDHADTIWDKRFHSVYPIRRHAHRSQYEALLEHVDKKDSILDSGCGEGVISFLLAQRGIASIGVDLSEPNILSAQSEIKKAGLSSFATFTTGDAERLPFPDRSFDTVISSHVLEHLPDFDQGFKELCRVARKRIIIALPTCLNVCAFALLGGDHGYWKFSKRSLPALLWGAMRVIWNIFHEGVQEGYAGHLELPHIWRYPWVMRRRLQHPDFCMKGFYASTLVVPYVSWLLPLTKFFERFRGFPFIRNFGFGSFIILDRIERK